MADLRAQNQEVITVQAGDAFYKVSDREYWLYPEQGAEGYQALVHDILASGRAPSRIVHLWLLAEGESFRPGSSFFHRNQERGFYSVLFLAQALSGQDYPRPLHIRVVSTGMQKVGSEPLAYPDMATVLGPVQGDAPGDGRNHLQQHRPAGGPPPRGVELCRGAGAGRRPWPARLGRA